MAGKSSEGSSTLNSVNHALLIPLSGWIPADSMVDLHGPRGLYERIQKKKELEERIRKKGEAPSEERGPNLMPSVSQENREVAQQICDRKKQLERRDQCEAKRRTKTEPPLYLTHDDDHENSSGPSEEQEAGSEVEALVQGCKRSLTISQETDEFWTRSRHRVWEEQAKQIPRFASWGPDSHLHSQKGQKFTRINVEGCKEIFVPEKSYCFYHDEKSKRDYWIRAVRKGRSEPHWTDWKRWYGPLSDWS